MFCSKRQWKEHIPWVVGILICVPILVFQPFFRFHSSRYVLLPEIIGFICIACELSLILKLFFPRRWRYLFFACAALVCGYCIYDLFDLDPYRHEIEKLSAIIRADASDSVSPLVLTFDKQALRYEYYTGLPVETAYHPSLETPNNQLPTYLSMFAEHHDRLYVIWEMESGDDYQEPSGVLPFFPGKGEWQRIVGGWTSQRKTKKRFLYRYTFSDEIRQNLPVYLQNAGAEQLDCGGMEHMVKLPPYYEQILGEEAGIPFFQESNTQFPEGVDFWIKKTWEPGCNGKIMITSDDPLDGASSLYCSAETPIQWMLKQWVPVKTAVISFRVKGNKDSRFQMFVHGKSEKTFDISQFPMDGSYRCNGEEQQFVFVLTERFLRPAESFRIGFCLLEGECLFDQVSCRYLSQTTDQ